MLEGGLGAPFDLNYPGNDLLSHAVTSAVPSALEGLTSVFGMGTGVAPPAKPPETFSSVVIQADIDGRCVYATNARYRDLLREIR